MNIEINLLPEELRPRPLVETKTLLLIVLIVALAGGCYVSFQAKANGESDVASLEKRIAEINEEIERVSTNPEAVALRSSISKLEAAQKNYQTFVASKVFWGDALERAHSHVPDLVGISELTQNGHTLKIEGTADKYSDATRYGRALDRDAQFTLTREPSFKSNLFSLTVEVASGGGK